MKHLPVYALLLLFVSYTSCEGQNRTGSPEVITRPETKVTSSEFSSVTRNVINADKGVIIQNSFPKGGPYTDPAGKRFGYGIFWTRVFNESAIPLELTINFPVDSFPIPPSPDSYFKLFLPPDTMTLNKKSLYDYGATGLKSFLDTHINKSTRLQKTINPKEEYIFYVALLMRVPDNGPVRTGFVLKEQDLFYKISIAGQLDSALIPCGHIILKK